MFHCVALPAHMAVYSVLIKNPDAVDGAGDVALRLFPTVHDPLMLCTKEKKNSSCYYVNNLNW